MIDSTAERVLVVDDEPDLRNLVAHGMQGAGFTVQIAGTGGEALAMARAQLPAVLILDLMLPDMLGIAVCAALRHDPDIEDLGILLLTARDREADRIDGLEAGADDYVVKPFSVRELVLRVRALVKRTRETRLARRAAGRGRVLRSGELEVDLHRHEVRSRGVQLAVRPLEFKLLAALLGQPGILRSRADLLRDVWGIEEETDSRTVDTHVRRLRERLGQHGASVETVHRFGYRWRDAG